MAAQTTALLVELLAELGTKPRLVWVSDVELPDTTVISPRASKTLLGQERDIVVFDAFAGFDPDAFGAVSGTICGGGLLLLLCPSLAAWKDYADPASERIAVWPYTIDEIKGRFLQRITRIICEKEGVSIVEQGASFPVIRPPPKTTESNDFSDDLYRTIDQKEAVAAIEHVVQGHRRRPVVLVSDRGHGKSAAMGIAAARLIQKAKVMRIVVTAPRLSAVESLFEQAQYLLPDAKYVDGCLQLGTAKIQYIAPDVLCLSPQPADLLLVDEAAAIPESMLRQLLQHYSRIAFATTVHGYEGTGRGFAVRFVQTLNTLTPQWRELRLQTPVRWADNDPLERLVFRALLLDASVVNDDAVMDASIDNVVIECLDRDSLTNDEGLLSQIFGLLVVAHYRTSPNDLRNLLDGPDLSVYVMRFKGHVVATALVSAEGGFDAAITEDIFNTVRRPRGHLIPQSLVTHVGIKQAANLRCARVMRIAVHPAVQRRGLGRRLLQFIRADAISQGFHLLGASFGATTELLAFWHNEKLLPVRVGFRRGHASGEYSVMVLAPLQEAGEDVCRIARKRLLADLPHWLSDPLRELNANVAAALFMGFDDDKVITLEAVDESMLQSFAGGARSYEDAIAPVWRLLIMALKNPNYQLSNQECSLLVMKVLQKRSWAEVGRLCGLAGRAEVIAGLRQAVQKLLETYTKSL
jgi:tRNA(Met) cytidine acetyltransferase